jgi:hypothetical protein
VNFMYAVRGNGRRRSSDDVKIAESMALPSSEAAVGATAKTTIAEEKPGPGGEPAAERRPGEKEGTSEGAGPAGGV